MEQQSPLNFPHVLVLVFNELRFTDKRNFLMVSKTWRNSVLAHWRYSNAVLCVDDARGWRRLRDLTIKLKKDKTTDCRFYAIHDKPFKNVHLRNSRMCVSSECRSEANIGQFNSFTVWNTFYNWNSAILTSLCLEDCRLHTIGSPVDGFRWILEKFGSLKTLEMTSCTFDCPDPNFPGADIAAASVSKTPSTCMSNEPVSKLRSLKLENVRYTSYFICGCWFYPHIPGNMMIHILELMPRLAEVATVGMSGLDFQWTKDKVFVPLMS